jgi:hypothetical protein
MEWHSSLDVTKSILGVQLFYQIGSTAHKRGFINVIDVDTGSGTQFVRNHSEVEFISGLCASTVDNKFVAILGPCYYVWDIDAGPAMPFHRYGSCPFLFLQIYDFGHAQQFFGEVFTQLCHILQVRCLFRTYKDRVTKLLQFYYYYYYYY